MVASLCIVSAGNTIVSAIIVELKKYEDADDDDVQHRSSSYSIHDVASNWTRI
jgi:hypothetical protein